MDNKFIPPENDKVVIRGSKTKIPVYFFLDPDDPSTIYIKTKDEVTIEDNSIYEVTINNIEFTDGDVQNKVKHKFFTKPSPAYVSIDAVLSLCRNLPIDKEDIMHHIRDASNIANYWANYHLDYNENEITFDPDTIEEDYYPFYMFVKYTAVLNCVKSFYIKAVSQPAKFKDAISDLEREEQMDLDAIKNLLDDLEEEAEDWLDLVTTITADPQWALRGKYSFAIISQNYRPYHPTLIDRDGWKRGY